MSERFTFVKRAATAAIAVGLTTAALAGCAEPDSHDDWTFTVTCPDESDLRVEGVRSGGESYEDEIDVTCATASGVDEAPVSIELLEGPESTTEIVNPTSPIGSNERTLSVQTTSDGGESFVIGAQEPRIGETVIDDALGLATISLSGVKSIDRVAVTTPGLETTTTTQG